MKLRNLWIKLVLDTDRRAHLVSHRMKNDLINSITNKKAHVGVIGLGYVGLPLLVEFASKGFQGTGFEVDESKAEQINAGDRKSVV